MSNRRWIIVLVLLAALGGFLWWQSGVGSDDPREVAIGGLPQDSQKGGDSREEPRPEVPSDVVAEAPDVAQDAAADAAEQERLDRLLFPRLDDSEWAIEGRVLDEKGVPLPGASISAMPLGRSLLETTHAESDARGFYRVGVIDEGRYRVTAELIPKSSETHDEVLAGSTGVDFVLGLRGAVEGRVLDSRTREPVTSFQIGFLRGRIPDPNPPGGFQFRGQGDLEGRFRLENVEAGDVSLFVRASGFVNAAVIVNDVPPGDTVRGVEVYLEPAYTISGLVVDSSGAPVANAEVVVYEAGSVIYHTSPTSRSDESGGFLVGGLVVGEYVVNGRHEDYASGEAAFTIPTADPVTVVLLAGGAIEGRVTLGGFSVPGAHMYISSDAIARELTARTDGEGHYHVTGVTPGVARVRASIGTHPITRSRSVESQVRVGETAVADIEFPLADASIEGNIYGANMEPAEASITLIVDSAGHIEHFRKSRALGAYAIEEVPPGPATLEALSEQGLLKRITVELVAGETLLQDIHLDTGFEIVCAFSVPGSEFDEIWAVAIAGELPPPEMTQTGLNEVRALAAASARSQHGEPVLLGGLEPGTYTVFSWAQPVDFHFAPRDTWPALIADAPAALAVVTLGEGNEREEIELVLR
ncbi:MAG: carboxypeptidase regulatory-like domain-containing protein [Candidatus Hydrogenedentes bacterium]|nr:carboxypeptidase regulatory-like domain-containing protein [Candidatus Hydrogenedentota bacterium]